MEKDTKRIEQLKLEAQIAVDEFNKIQEKIKQLMIARDALKMKAFSCSERIKELQGQTEVAVQAEQKTVN